MVGAGADSQQSCNQAVWYGKAIHRCYEDGISTTTAFECMMDTATINSKKLKKAIKGSQDGEKLRWGTTIEPDN